MGRWSRGPAGLRRHRPGLIFLGRDVQLAENKPSPCPSVGGVKRESRNWGVASLSTVLRMLSEGRYTARESWDRRGRPGHTALELKRIVPTEVVMGSSLLAQVRRASWAEGWVEGWAEGRAQVLGLKAGPRPAEGRAAGDLTAARSLCVALAKQHHAAVFPRLALAIEACPDAGILLQWTLAAPRASHEAFVQLVQLLQGRVPAAPAGPRRAAPARTSRGRAARPSLRATPARRR